MVGSARPPNGESFQRSTATGIGLPGEPVAATSTCTRGKIRELFSTLIETVAFASWPIVGESLAETRVIVSVVFAATARSAMFT